MLLKQKVLIVIKRSSANDKENEIGTKVNDYDIDREDENVEKVKLDIDGGVDCVRDNGLNQVP